MTVKKVWQKKIIALPIIIAIFISLSAGCSSVNDRIQKEQSVKDSLGREIIIGQYPKKIISLAPAITEILFAIGLDQEIIGVSDYCDYPEKAKAKAKMGGFQNPNVELVASKDPDMVFISAGVQEEFIRKLEEINIKVVVLDADTIEQVIANIELAGQLTGKEEPAQKVAADMKAKLAEITAKVKDRPKPKVFFEVWDDPLMSAGSGSFINNMIETAGGNNVAATSKERYYNYSVEKLLETNPDIYIINSHSHTPADIKKRTGYMTLSAVQNDKVFMIDDNLISRAGPRVIQGLEAMARYFHPEAFKE